MVRLVSAVAVLAIAATCSVSPSTAFAPVNTPNKPARSTTTALAAGKANLSDDGGKRFAATVVTSAYLLGGLVFGADAALADAYATTTTLSSPDFGGTSTVLAAKSGGRAGGRVGTGGAGNARSVGYGGSSSSYSSSSSPSSSSFPSVTKTRVIERNTIIERPQVVTSSPAVIYAAPPPPLYAAPDPSFGLVMGINAIGAIGEGMREARQEREIQQSKAELMVARERERAMEERLRGLEQQQMMQQQSAMNQQLLQNQLQMQAAAVAR